jgi:hypothetical protein
MRTAKCFIVLLGFALASCGQVPESGSVLYNGIELPAVWPPRYEEPDTAALMPVPYLENKPAVIPVNVGRQLFVDDFLVSESDMKTVCHKPLFYSGNPVLEPTEEWEKTVGGAPYAAPFSDGIWYDEQDGKFKLWYLAGAGSIHKYSNQTFYTGYAESEDGKNWKKVQCDILPGTNIVDTCDRDAATVWLDKLEKDPAKRFKFFNVERQPGGYRWQFILKYSPDGIHWSEGVAQSGDINDRSSAFYNPFRKVWCLSMRHGTKVSGRSRAYLESSDPEEAVSLAHRVRRGVADRNVVFWFTPDNLDLRNPDFPEIDPAIYNFDCIPYESVMLGQYSVWQGPENDVCGELGIQKRNEVVLGFSRDGFHFVKPSHEAFLGVDHSEGAWNWGNMQSICGTPLIVGDSLYFYSSGRRLNDIMWDSYTSTGLATLRRDGFVSKHAGEGECSLTTEVLSFDGEYLFVNADVKGSFKVEVLSKDGSSLKEQFTLEPFDSTKCLVGKVGRFAGKEVRLRFSMSDGDLYSFWVSPVESGESFGYTAGGGPGLSPDGIDKPISR